MKTLVKNCVGFTIIELVVTIIITGIIVGIASNTFHIGIESYYTGQQTADLVTQTTTALMQMNHELRLATSINTISASSINFTTMNNDVIQYSFSSSSITRTQNSGTAYTLINTVSSLTFSYFGTGGATTASAAAVSFITVALTLSNGTITYSQSTTVHPRLMP